MVGNILANKKNLNIQSLWSKSLKVGILLVIGSEALVMKMDG